MAFLSLQNEQFPKFIFFCISKGLKIDYKYQLVLALTNIDIKLTYEKNIKNYVLVFKNFINDHWYQKTGETTEDMTKKIKDLSVQQLISEQKPNILIYKKLNDNKDN